MSVILAALLAAAAPADDMWSPLRNLLDGWEFTSNYAITVGTDKGQLFKYEGGNFTLETLIPTGSTSKWPSAMMVAGLVNDGTIKSLDSKVSDYLPWWTTNSSDLRSTVTLRMLLSFTSGFGGGHPGQEGNSRASRSWRAENGLAVSAPPLGLAATLEKEHGAAAAKPCDTATGDVTLCAKSIYEHVALIGTPGQVYSYNSNHLQIAAAMAVGASKLPIKSVISKYLLVPNGMNASYYDGKCPDFGGSLMTTGADYERFLSGLLTYTSLRKPLIQQSEIDHTPFLADYYTLYGDYGFGHFLMCFDSYDGFTHKCKEAQCHMDPGAFGFIPIIDRKNNYYMQVVAAEIGKTGSYPLSGIPEYLAVAIKPHIDAILSKKPPDAGEHMTHSAGLLSLGVADVNYCLNCKLYPASCM